MFAGFKLSDIGYYENLYKIGYDQYQIYRKLVRKTLSTHVGVDGVLNGSNIQEDWFPQINADIFLSHSHKDLKKALTLAGFLSSMGLSVFIDSCIWGYAPDLLKEIDSKYCMNTEKTHYLYENRNKSTSHVHMMLSTALNMMIDKTECIFFLNTPNTIEPSSVIEETISPWIYSEIIMTKLVRKRELSEYRVNINKSLNESIRTFSNDLKIKYKLNTSHLIDLEITDLEKWIEAYDETAFPKANALDTLYEILIKTENYKLTL